MIGELGEDALIATILERFRTGGPGAPSGGPAVPSWVRVGPGDDAAVLDVAGPVVVSTDTLVEGFDFRPAWSSARDVGIKTAAQNLADVAAMGGRPLALVVSLAAPPQLPAGWAAELADGLAEECRRAGAVVVGGDVSQASETVITGTAIGVLPGPAVLRSGARPADLVALAGVTGPSGAGLGLFAAGLADRVADDADLAALLAAHRAPRPPYPAGPVAAAAGAHAMIDTSDGLLRDAGRVAAASEVVIDLDVDALAPSGPLVRAAELLGRPEIALEWVLTGGEDHALLACLPPDAALPAGFRPIGRVLHPGERDDVRPGTVLVGGRPWTGSTGWHHFA
jgi:thiamine-monophosphate kinase